MQGTDLSWFRKLRRATSLAGYGRGRSSQHARGSRTRKMGMNAAVGMAIYTGKLAAEKTGFAKQLAADVVAVEERRMATSQLTE